MENLRRLLINDKFNFRFLILWVIILSILYSTLSILRHMHFQSGGFDLGIYDQAVWQYSNFLFPYNTIKERLILGDHLTLTLPLLAPLYWIWDNVKILLIFQSIWISFSTVAVYLVTKIRKFSPFVCFSIAFLYSLFYGIQFAIFFDFHPIVIGIGLFAWSIYFLEAKRKKLFLLSLTLALFTQEDMGLVLAGLGFIYFFRKGYRKSAILFIVLGIFSSLIETRIVSLLSPVGYEYLPQISHNPFQVVKDLFNDPQKIQTWIYSLGWFSFLPVFSLGSLAAITTNLAQFFITGPGFNRMWSPFTHHHAILAIFLFLGTLDTLGFIRRLNKKYLNLALIVLLLLIIALSQQFIFHFPLNKLSKPIYWRSEEWMKDNNNLFSQIPKNAGLATTQNLIPHLSHRKEIYLIYPRIKTFNGICEDCWWLEFAGKPEYMILDLRPNQTITQLLESNEHFQSAVRNMESAGRIKKVRNISYATLYKINY
ncbi:MAG: DUF2079 domain-containing protein [Patescibacteria group bacterium]